jgi:hypothetical protein
MSFFSFFLLDHCSMAHDASLLRRHRCCGALSIGGVYQQPTVVVGQRECRGWREISCFYTTGNCQCADGQALYRWLFVGAVGTGLKQGRPQRVSSTQESRRRRATCADSHNWRRPGLASSTDKTSHFSNLLGIPTFREQYSVFLQYCVSQIRYDLVKALET